MKIIMQFLMLMMVISSMYGYMQLTKKMMNLQAEFIPIFVFSSVSCAVYFSGLAGILYPGSILILTIGLVFFIRYLVIVIKEKRYSNFKPSLFHVTFTVGTLPFLYLLIKSKLVHYDNFSHWAIVVKQMLITNAFPHAGSVLVDFKNYPLGISSFIYFIIRFVGNAQHIMILAQGLLIFSCFYAFFGIIKEKKRYLLYAFMAAGFSILSFFNITIRINNLLVDFLLPLYTLVLFVIIYIYQKEIKKASVTIVPIAGLLMITKNNGIIFAAIAFTYFIFVWLKNKEKPLWKSGGIVFASIIASAVPFLLWTLHMTYGFQGVENKFEVSTQNIQNMAGGKSEAEIRQIISLFVRSVFDIKSRPMIGIIGFNLVVVLACIVVAIMLKKNWKLWKALIALDLVLVIYYTGILGLYIYSMPLDEAIILAGFERYASSIIILFGGGLVLCATVDIEDSFYYKTSDRPAYLAFKSVESKEWYQKGVLFFTALSIVMLMSEYNGMKTIQSAYESTLPHKVYSITGDQWPLDGKVDDSRYLFYASDKDAQVTNYYLQYIGKYMLYASHVDGICEFYEDNLIHLLRSYDHLVIIESDLEVRHLLKKYFAVSGEEGIYKIIHLSDTLTLEIKL